MKKSNFYRELDRFIDELYADGTVGKWKVEKKLKEAKGVQRKTARTINEYRARKTA